MIVDACVHSLTGPFARCLDIKVAAGEYAATSGTARTVMRLVLQRDRAKMKPEASLGSKPGTGL